MRILLPILALAGLVSCQSTTADSCKEAFLSASSAASDSDSKCAALGSYSRCLALVTQSLSLPDKLALDALVAEAQIAIGVKNCSDVDSSGEPHRIRHDKGDVKISINEGSDFKFFRFRRESVSIWDLQAQYDASVAGLRDRLQKTLHSNDVSIQRQSADSDGRVSGLRAAVDILMADVSSRTSQVVSLANAATVTTNDVQLILNDATSSSEAVRFQKQNLGFDPVKESVANDMSQALSTIRSKRDNIRVRFQDGLKKLNDAIDANKQTISTTKSKLAAQVQAELNKFLNNTEENLNIKNVFPTFTDGLRDNNPCNSSDIGLTYLSKPTSRPEQPISPASTSDTLNGVGISMSSYSHGSGYSVALREVWNPQWDTTLVYRFDADTYASKGTMVVGRTQVMQCAGDERGFFYGAHWGHNLFCKYGPFPDMTTEKWCYNAGCTASGVGVNGTHLIGVCSNLNQIFIINRETGQLSTKVTMQGWPSSSNNGLAFSGTRLWWLYPNQAYEFDVNDGSLKRTFGLAAAPYAVFTDGEKFCISPNSDIFYCYRIQKENIYGGAISLYYCNGIRNLPL